MDSRNIIPVALRTVQDVVVAVQLGARADRRGVRTGFGFGKCKRRDGFAGGNAGQPFVLLGLGPEHDETLAADADIGAEG